MGKAMDWKYLSPIDIFIPPQYVRQILCFPAADASSMPALRHGLERTVAKIPSLSSSVSPISSSSPSSKDLLICRPVEARKNGRFYLGPPEFSITDIFSEQRHNPFSGTDFASLKEAGYPNKLLDKNCFFPHLPHFPVTDDTAPAFRAQVTQMRGGIILGLCWHHSLADLAGFNAVLETWSFFCRQCHDEEGAKTEQGRRASAVKPAPLIECHREVVGRPSLSQAAAGLPCRPAHISLLDSSPPALTSAIIAALPIETVHLRISTETVRRLKVQLTEHLQQGMKLSSNDIICAMMWSATTYALTDPALYSPESLRDHPLQADGLVSMGLSVDMRQRLNPPLPRNFVGNVLAMAWPTLPRKNLLDAIPRANTSSFSASLARIAICIRQSQESLTGTYFNNLVSYLDSCEDITRLHWGPPREGINMVAANWTGYNIHSLDWGTGIGRCDAVRTRHPFPHTFTVLPQAADTESIDVTYCLLAPTMQRLKDCSIIKQYWQVVEGGSTGDHLGAGN